jgi:hypothetical protein
MLAMNGTACEDGFKPILEQARVVSKANVLSMAMAESSLFVIMKGFFKYLEVF